jgi:hypothetical protein
MLSFEICDYSTTLSSEKDNAQRFGRAYGHC